MTARKLFLIVGTRPEAIKLAGLAFLLRAQTEIDWMLVSTGQHRSMLDDTLHDLNLTPHVNLDVMDVASGPSQLTSLILGRLAPVMAQHAPSIVVVQGDTTSAMASSLAAFYRSIPVAHVEAGLRTHNLANPWPEEANRRIIATLATYHFAPTAAAAANLRAEGIPDRAITITGNPVIDTLLHTRAALDADPALSTRIAERFAWLDPAKKLILVTGHRHENIGAGFANICDALKALSRRGDVDIVYPVHLNPRAHAPIRAMLADEPAIHLIDPVPYTAFVALMSRARLILTDSGGIQEEAPSLGKPVLVMRTASERLEAIAQGMAKIVGSDPHAIVTEANRLLDEPSELTAMTSRKNPYGDGSACRRILDVLSLAAPAS